VEIVRPLLRGHAKENAEAMRASAGRVHDAVGCMDQALSSAPYPAGDDITAADIVALPNFREPNAECCDGSLDVELGWWKCIKDLTYLER
jgi:glutathione S-transferase